MLSLTLTNNWRYFERIARYTQAYWQSWTIYFSYGQHNGWEREVCFIPGKSLALLQECLDDQEDQSRCKNLRILREHLSLSFHVMDSQSSQIDHQGWESQAGEGFPSVGASKESLTSLVSLVATLWLWDSNISDQTCVLETALQAQDVGFESSRIFFF